MLDKFSDRLIVTSISLFRELDTELESEGWILPPIPNRVLKLCVLNRLAKSTILSSNGASFSF